MFTNSDNLKHIVRDKYSPIVSKDCMSIINHNSIFDINRQHSTHEFEFQMEIQHKSWRSSTILGKFMIFFNQEMSYDLMIALSEPDVYGMLVCAFKNRHQKRNISFENIFIDNDSLLLKYIKKLYKKELPVINKASVTFFYASEDGKIVLGNYNQIKTNNTTAILYDSSQIIDPNNLI